MGKKKCPDCPRCLPNWLVAFGDLMSLLLCFFVLLLSMSSMDVKKVNEAIGSLEGALSVLEGGKQTEINQELMMTATPVEQTEDTTEQIAKVSEAITDLNEMTEKGHGPSAELEDAEEGFVIKLPSALLFKPGQAKIDNEDALLFLKRIALLIEQMPRNVDIAVRGYTDNEPPGKDSLYKNNWELSSARAIAVLQELVLDGVAPERMHAAGYGQYQNIATNATESGREKNRRVELHFFMEKASNKKGVQSVLDEAGEK